MNAWIKPARTDHDCYPYSEMLTFASGEDKVLLGSYPDDDQVTMEWASSLEPPDAVDLMKLFTDKAEKSRLVAYLRNSVTVSNSGNPTDANQMLDDVSKRANTLHHLYLGSNIPELGHVAVTFESHNRHGLAIPNGSLTLTADRGKFAVTSMKAFFEASAPTGFHGFYDQLADYTTPVPAPAALTG